MAIAGHYLKPNFFDRETQRVETYFYLCDGGRTNKHSPIMRITDVYVSIDMDTNKAFLVIPNAYGIGDRSPFFAEFNLNNGLKSLRETFEYIHEWLGYREQWRKVGRTYKTCTIITIEDGEIDNIEVQTGLPQ